MLNETVAAFAGAWVMPALAVALLLCVVRLVRGPELPDRVVALDLMMVIGVALIAVYAITQDNAVLLDIALVSALLAFLGTVAFGYYLEHYG